MPARSQGVASTVMKQNPRNAASVARSGARWVTVGLVCATLGAVAIGSAAGGWPGGVHAQAQPAPGTASPGSPEIRPAPTPYYGPVPELEKDPSTQTTALPETPSKNTFAIAQAGPAISPQPSAEGGDKLAWATGYPTWFQVTGYWLSPGHGMRFAEVRATPFAAARVHLRNSDLVRHKKEGFESYPVGTLIAMPTWDIANDWSRGVPGPIFFMRKEPAGYDPEGGDWRYGMTRPDLTALVDGKDGHATECRSCHMQLRARDFVPAVDR